MWNLSQNSRNFLPVNWDLLSVMMEFGTPKRWTMSVKNVSACSALRFVIEDHVWFEDRWMVASLCDE
jgi:hypothetical protein